MLQVQCFLQKTKRIPIGWQGTLCNAQSKGNAKDGKDTKDKKDWGTWLCEVSALRNFLKHMALCMPQGILRKYP